MSLKILLPALAAVALAAGAGYLAWSEEPSGGGTADSAGDATAVPDPAPAPEDSAPAPSAPPRDYVIHRDGGMWMRRRDAAAGEAVGEERARLEDLRSLPYVTGSRPPAARRGVVRHEPDSVQPGYNLYSSAHGAEAFLIDMEGKVLHRWHLPREEVWPDLRRTRQANEYFRRLRLFENGDLLAIYEYTGLVKIDADSRLLWSHQGFNHHDLDVDGEGNIWGLVRQGRAWGPKSRWVFDDCVQVLDPNGNEIERISLLDCIDASGDPDLVELVTDSTNVDILHTNTIELLDGSQAEQSPAFARGNVLVSMRNIGVIGVVDPRERRMVWAEWGDWRMQHQPVLLDSGRMLLFDNRTIPPGDRTSVGSSRVVEFDPLTGEVHWQWEGTDEVPFYSSLCGSNQRLPNGNTLITESDYGRVIEVTPDGRIVWEFRNPHTTGADDEFVAVVPEMIRLPPSFPVAGFAGG